MPTLTIEERIHVSAPPARVWAFLLDPARVAPCLPGAKLDGVEGDKTFLGTMKVKVGPVTMDFKGKATMTEIHEAERRVVMIGTGSDKGGSGSAKMSMESRIIATADGGSEIVVTADVDLAGKLMGFGRGMMGGISKQLFKQFSERVRAHLAEEEEEEEEESAADEAAPVAPAAAVEEKAADEKEAVVEAAPAAVVVAPAVEAAPVAAPAAEEAAAPATASEGEAPKDAPVEAKGETAKVAPAADAETKSAPADTSEGAEESAPPELDEKAVPAPAKKASPATGGPAKVKKKKASTAIVPEDNAPLSAGGLVFAAFWEWLKGVFGRVFGRRP